MHPRAYPVPAPPPYAVRGPWPPPPMMQLRPHLFPPPPPLPLPFAHAPRFFPPPPPPPVRLERVDPEALWLQTFAREHLPRADEDDAQTEPPLRRLCAAIATAQTLLAQLRTVARDALATETRVRQLEAASDGGDAIAQLELSRLRLQRDRKLASCAALKARLEAMDAATLFCRSEDELADVTRFALLAKKKRAYRKRAAKRRRVEATILGGMRQPAASSADSSADAVGRSAEDASAAAPEPSSSSSADAAAAAREQARKVLSLLELKEQRAGVLNADERQEIAEMRAAALACLERKPRKRRTAPPHAPTDTPTAAAAEPEERASRPSRALVDPETIDMATLVAVRTAWDQFLVPPRTFAGSSTIPSHFVPPPATPSAQWAVFLDAT